MRYSALTMTWPFAAIASNGPNKYRLIFKGDLVTQDIAILHRVISCRRELKAAS